MSCFLGLLLLGPLHVCLRSPALPACLHTPCAGQAVSQGGHSQAARGVGGGESSRGWGGSKADAAAAEGSTRIHVTHKLGACVWGGLVVHDAAAEGSSCAQHASTGCIKLYPRMRQRTWRQHSSNRKQAAGFLHACCWQHCVSDHLTNKCSHTLTKPASAPLALPKRQQPDKQHA